MAAPCSGAQGENCCSRHRLVCVCHFMWRLGMFTGRRCGLAARQVTSQCMNWLKFWCAAVRCVLQPLHATASFMTSTKTCFSCLRSPAIRCESCQQACGCSVGPSRYEEFFSLYTKLYFPFCRCLLLIKASFLQREAMNKRGLCHGAVSICPYLSVWMYVTFVYCI